jgi:hypothetical protein
LMWETMRVTGLARGLSAGLARWRAPRGTPPTRLDSRGAALISFTAEWSLR